MHRTFFRFMNESQYCDSFWSVRMVPIICINVSCSAPFPLAWMVYTETWPKWKGGKWFQTRSSNWSHDKACKEDYELLFFLVIGWIYHLVSLVQTDVLLVHFSESLDHFTAIREREKKRHLQEHFWTLKRHQGSLCYRIIVLHRLLFQSV
jgi:hypothetical protein